ncbi:hypothetical protein D3C71_1465260 [compost metagenome]
MRQGRLDGQHHATYVHRQQLVQRRQIQAVDRCMPVQAGIDHQHIQPTEGLRSGGHGPAQRIGIAAVSLEGERAATVRADGIKRCLRPIGARDVGDGDVMAINGQALRNGRTDAA